LAADAQGYPRVAGVVRAGREPFGMSLVSILIVVLIVILILALVGYVR
jgi:flagellar basal body-associated protein FliL